MEALRYLVIEFLDGKKETFTFPRQTDNLVARKLRFQDFLQGQFIVLQIERGLQAFPVSAIRSIHLSGFDEGDESWPLPPSAIRGAEHV